jgi:hypothetical protein
MSWLTKSLDVLARAGEADELEKAARDADARNDLKDSDFALPGRRYPIHDASHARNALARVAQHGNADEQAKVKAAVHSRYPDIGEMEKAEVAYTCPLRKSDVEGKFYGVVLEPGLEDSQGDIFAPAEIEKACHGFMRDYSLSKAEHSPDVQHSGRDAGADLIENYIAPMDMVLGGEPVTKSSWVQAWQIDDPLVKQEVDEGKLTGLSLEGLGFRHPVEV